MFSVQTRPCLHVHLFVSQSRMSVPLARGGTSIRPYHPEILKRTFREAGIWIANKYVWVWGQNFPQKSNPALYEMHLQICSGRSVTAIRVVFTGNNVPVQEVWHSYTKRKVTRRSLKWQDGCTKQQDYDIRPGLVFSPSYATVHTVLYCYYQYM